MSKPQLDLTPDYGKKVRLLRVAMGLNQSEFARLMGFTKNTVGSVEAGGKPSERFKQQVEALEKMEALSESGEKSNFVPMPERRRDVPLADPNTTGEIIPVRWIPLIASAQAGEATDYEELAKHMQKLVPSVSDDPMAFAITIAGDSQEPRYHDGDVATVTPSKPLRQNDLVIARIRDQGAVFKLYTRHGDTIKFSSYNPAYLPFEVHASELDWIYRIESVLKIVNK